jgi:TRAP-type C4-dicarboxylate transport system permease large subunit
MVGAGLGVVMTDARVTHTLVHWIVKYIGVNTQKKAKISLVVCSMLICGLLGTLGGGNAVIAPILIPVMASLGVTPSVVAVLFNVAGQSGLMLGPLAGVTLITMEMTGLTYGQLMVGAVIPFILFWLGGAWFAVKRTQRRTEGKEAYELTDDMKDISSIVITPREKFTTIVFLVSFIGMIVYGIITRQGVSYALLVLIVLCAVVGIASRMKIDQVVTSVGKGVASMSYMLLIFVSLDVLINYITVAGGFSALAGLMEGFTGENPTAIMFMALLVGTFGMEAAAVAEIRIIGELFGEAARAAGLPMTLFALSMICANRITGALYPSTNLVGQLGIARCSNTKEVLRAHWIACGSAMFFVLVWSIVGVRVLG